MAKYYVFIDEDDPDEMIHHGPYDSLVSAKSFARIGSQKGKFARVVVRYRRDGEPVMVRIYFGGKRIFPTTEEELKGLSATERPRKL